jgi:hypothetical protein
MSIRNLDYLRSLSSKEFPDLGAKLYEALADLDQQHSTLAQQVNGNSTGQPIAPPPIAGLTVTGQNGHFQIGITDTAPIYRDIHYFVEHADNPHFVNPHVIHLGQSRNFHLFLGNVTRYFRAYSAYSSSAPGTPSYFGSRSKPTAVQGGGTVGGPDFVAAQGSGTGAAGEGLQGPGVIPFRTTTGAAPVR